MNVRLKRAVELSRAFHNLERARRRLEYAPRDDQLIEVAERYADAVDRHDRAVREMRLGDRPTPV